MDKLKHGFIKLYARTCIEWKSISKEVALKEIDEISSSENFHEIQLPKYTITPTKRKRKPFNVSVSFYDWETIRQMVTDKLRCC